jgi:hypothetical protein
MHPFFEFLSNEGLLKWNRPQLREIEKLSKVELIEVARVLGHLLETPDEEPAWGIFQHAVSMSVTGRDKCERLEHRLDNVLQLANFSALYSDRIYVGNFFWDYDDDFAQRPKQMLQHDLFTDITLATAVRPLIEADLLRFFSPTVHICKDCIEKEIGEGIWER